MDSFDAKRWADVESALTLLNLITESSATRRRQTSNRLHYKPVCINTTTPYFASVVITVQQIRYCSLAGAWVKAVSASLPR